MTSGEPGISLTEGFHFGFDWAHDVEYQLQLQEAHSWDLCHDSEDPLSPKFAGNSSEGPRKIANERDIEYITEDGMTFNDANIVSIPSTEEISLLDQLRQGIAEEFRGREDTMVHDKHIHHFNWLEDPVYQASATTPAESLAIICSGPKIPKESEKLRIGSTLHRAYQFLDPVVVSLERTSERLFENRGFSLQKAAEGHVFKFYTPQGRWLVDPHVFDSGIILLDTGSMDVYLNSNYSVGNGFVRPSLIPNTSAWQSARHEILRFRQCSSLPRKNTWSPPSPSPLRQSTTVSDDVSEVPKKALWHVDPRAVRPLDIAAKLLSH